MLGVDNSNNVCNNERVENKQESENHYENINSTISKRKIRRTNRQ